jgi:hypothetical protein
MKNLIKKIIQELYDKNINMDLNSFIMNIYLYLLLIKQLKNDKNKNIINYYKIFIEDMNTKYNFQIKNISMDKLQNLIMEQILIYIEYDTINLIAEIIKSIKELKIFHQDINNYIVDVNSHKLLLKLINNDPNNKPNNKIINLFSKFGSYIHLLMNKNINYDSITLSDNNIFMINLTSIIFNINNVLNINIIHTDVIYDNHIKDKYNIVIADIPSNIHNLIHAKCSERIKQYKLRGTKSEPLIIQLIISLLDDGSSAYIIVQNSMLFGESNQHIQTRKYLIENYNIEKIISLNNNKSLLIFKLDKNPTSDINFYNIKSYNNTFICKVDLDIEFIININKNQLIDNNYSLYCHNYQIKKNQIESIKNNFCELKDIINIYSYDDYIKNPSIIDTNTNILIAYRTVLFKISNIEQIPIFDYIFITKNETTYMQKYLNNYLITYFMKNNHLIIRGKTKQLDIDKINKLTILFPSINIQNHIIKYINQIDINITSNNKQINTLEDIKIEYIQNKISYLPTKKISEICTIKHSSSNIDTIVINKNSNLAGTVNLTTTEEQSLNKYYLTINNLDNFLNKYIYLYLKVIESNLIEQSKLNNTIQLSKNRLENIDIPIMTLDQQQNCIQFCEHIDNKINSYLNMNNNMYFIELFDNI